MNNAGDQGSQCRIPVDHGQLEGLLDEPDVRRGAAVLCHPHPQHGGTMHTKALYHAARALNDVGLATLRFNFRGVGASSGEFDGGRGERRDVLAALDYLAERFEPNPLLLGGFSFGAMVGLPVGHEDDRVQGLLGMGLPLSMDPFDWLAAVRKPTLLLQAANDQFGSVEDLKRRVSGNSKWITLRVVPETGHLFTDALETLGGEIREYYRQGKGSTLLES